ncbi:Serine protease trypsin-like protein [Phytophthora megakarya]|uniref:Serine protease trypsin-like protein n=1 Tax=Phytophthora megakarya TaxID=4795 RepID=A0A225VK48_9STRA|nr:Serine protease trypsin-like protein [Phytophthora megakarya]
MNLAAVVAISTAVFASSSYATTYKGHVGRELILSGKVVPSGTKTYMTGLRVSRDSESYCGASLISPTHVLTASHCTAYNPHWVSIGEHYRNGTQIGEQIKIVTMMNHPNYSVNVQYADDFMILELERPSKFKPVKLAAADDSDFKPGKMATTMGWGKNAEVNGNFSYELQRVDVALDSCEADSGGPLIVESSGGEDVLVGVVSWAKDNTCGREGYYGVYSRVSSVRAWIDTITSASGICVA